MITDEGLVNTPILAHAASDPSGVMFSMEEIADDSNHYLAQELEQMLSGVDAQTVSELKSDQQFLFFHGERSPGDQDRQARLCIVSQCIQQTIDELRLNLLARSTE